MMVNTVNEVVHDFSTGLLNHVFASPLTLGNFFCDDVGLVRFRLNPAQLITRLATVGVTKPMGPKGSALGIALKPQLFQCIVHLCCPEYVRHPSLTEGNPDNLEAILQRYVTTGRYTQTFVSRLLRLQELFNRENLSLPHLLHTRLFKTEMKNFWTSLGRTSMDSTPLLDAVRTGDPMAVLKCAGTFSRMSSRTGKTGLMIASTRGATELISMLVLSESNMWTRERRCATELSVESGNIEAVRLLAPYEKPYLQRIGMTDLMLHVLGIPTTRSFKELLVDVRCQNAHGWTALMIAAMLREEGYVIAIVKHEARLKTYGGETAGTLAYRRGYRRIARLLSMYEEVVDEHGNTQLHRAALANDGPGLRMTPISYISKALNKKGFTALALAAQRNHYHIVKALLPFEQGVRCMTTLKTPLFDVQNPTALALAVFNSHPESVNLTKRLEAGVTFQPLGVTSLMIAAVCGHDNIVSLLLTREARLCDLQGNTALMYSVHSGSFVAVNKLRRKEAKMQNARGETALMWAARINNLQAVATLLDEEAGIVDKEGNSALTYAVVNGSIDCLQVLLVAEGEKHVRRAQERLQNAHTTLSERVKRQITRRLVTFVGTVSEEKPHSSYSRQTAR